VNTAAPNAAATVTPQTVTFRSVFAVGEFRALWLAQVLSVAGDQLARVAMTVLVYDQTRSSFWSALTYAVTLVPWVFGGLALSGLADRLPRRQLMVGSDLARMVLVGVMALLSLRDATGTGLLIMVALLFVVTLLDSPFKAARSAMMPDILTGDLYVLGVAVSQTALQSGLVAGFALGGSWWRSCTRAGRSAWTPAPSRSPPCWFSSACGGARPRPAPGPGAAPRSARSWLASGWSSGAGYCARWSSSAGS